MHREHELLRGNHRRSERVGGTVAESEEMSASGKDATTEVRGMYFK